MGAVIHVITLLGEVASHRVRVPGLQGIVCPLFVFCYPPASSYPFLYCVVFPIIVSLALHACFSYLRLKGLSVCSICHAFSPGWDITCAFVWYTVEARSSTLVLLSRRKTMEAEGEPGSATIGDPL